MVDNLGGEQRGQAIENEMEKNVSGPLKNIKSEESLKVLSGNEARTREGPSPLARPTTPIFKSKMTTEIKYSSLLYLRHPIIQERMRIGLEFLILYKKSLFYF